MRGQLRRNVWWIYELIKVEDEGNLDSYGE